MREKIRAKLQKIFDICKIFYKNLHILDNIGSFFILYKKNEAHFRASILISLRSNDYYFFTPE